MRDGRLPLRSSRRGPNRQVQEGVEVLGVQSGSEEKVWCLDVCLVWIEMVSSAASSVPSRPDRSCETSLLRSGILSRQLRSTTTHSATDWRELHASATRGTLDYSDLAGDLTLRSPRGTTPPPPCPPHAPRSCTLPLHTYLFCQSRT